MATLPSTLALVTIPDGAPRLSSDHRSNNTAIQTEANALLTILSAGTAGQLFSGVGTTVKFAGLPAIFDTTLGSAQATIDIQNIPQTFAHLMMRFQGRSDIAGAVGSPVNLRFNNDSAGNYDSQKISGTGAAVTGGENFAQTGARVGNGITGNTAAAGIASSFVLYLPNYTGTAFNKNFVAAYDEKLAAISGFMETVVQSGFWRSSAAINQITLLTGTDNFMAGTRCTLYGIG